MTTDTERDVDHHDPTLCDECNNTGYVIQYIDGGRLIARVPCGCPQSEEPETQDDDLPKPTDWWVKQKSWAKEVVMTYSSSVFTDITISLQRSVREWFKIRNTGDDAGVKQYCRQRCREYMLALRQHRRADRREWL